MQGLRAEHEIHEWRALDDAIALLRRHTATDADQDRLSALFQLPPTTELTEHLFLRFFANRAGIDQDNVGFFGDRGEFKAFVFGQNVGHLRRIVLVHLATVGLDEELALGRTRGRTGGWAGIEHGEGNAVGHGISGAR